MPELPEVETARRAATAVAVGRRIVGVTVADDPIVFEHVPPGADPPRAPRAAGPAVRRHGKHFWFELDRPARGSSCTSAWPAASTRRDGGACGSCRAGGAADTGWPPRFMQAPPAPRRRRRARASPTAGAWAASDSGAIRATEPPIAALGFDALRGLPGAARFRALARSRAAAGEGALARPVLRGGRRQLDRRRGALSGAHRPPPRGSLAVRPRAGPAPRPPPGDCPARGGRRVRQRAATRPRGSSTAAGTPGPASPCGATRSAGRRSRAAPPPGFPPSSTEPRVRGPRSTPARRSRSKHREGADRERSERAHLHRNGEETEPGVGHAVEVAQVLDDRDARARRACCAPSDGDPRCRRCSGNRCRRAPRPVGPATRRRRRSERDGLRSSDPFASGRPSRCGAAPPCLERRARRARTRRSRAPPGPPRGPPLPADPPGTRGEAPPDPGRRHSGGTGCRRRCPCSPPCRCGRCGTPCRGRSGSRDSSRVQWSRMMGPGSPR